MFIYTEIILKEEAFINKVLLVCKEGRFFSSFNQHTTQN